MIEMKRLTALILLLLAASLLFASVSEAKSSTYYLQQRLIEKKFLPAGSADGKYGYQTRQGVMAAQKWLGLTRDGVAGKKTWRALVKTRGPRPRNEKKGGTYIEILINKQLMLLVHKRQVRQAISISSGRPGYDTPRGSYRIYRKVVDDYSYKYSSPMPYSSYFIGGVAIHQSADIPPYPASHGCVRTPAPFAARVYDFAKLGRQVIVR